MFIPRFLRTASWGRGGLFVPSLQGLVTFETTPFSPPTRNLGDADDRFARDIRVTQNRHDGCQPTSYAFTGCIQACSRRSSTAASTCSQAANTAFVRRP